MFLFLVCACVFMYVACFLYIICHLYRYIYARYDYLQHLKDHFYFSLSFVQSNFFECIILLCASDSSSTP